MLTAVIVLYNENLQGSKIVPLSFKCGVCWDVFIWGVSSSFLFTFQTVPTKLKP